MLLNDAFGLVEGALGFRFVLRLFSANAQTPLVAFVYHWTDVLLQPVAFIFPNATIGTSVIDFVALAAMVIYSIIFILVIKLVRFILTGSSVY